MALVGRNHPLGVVIAALFFATLSQGGLAIHALVPKQMVEVLQGLVILAVAASVPEVRRMLILGTLVMALGVVRVAFGSRRSGALHQRRESFGCSREH